MEFTELMARAGGHAEARIIQTAVELTIFDALENCARTATSIAGELKLEPKATALLLNALAALKLLDKQAQAFSLSEAAARYLLRDSPQYLGGMIRFEASLWNAWAKLPEAIRSGQPVRAPNMYQDDPAETETFIQAMDSLVNARGDTKMLANALDWHDVGDLLDVGSGPATYPVALCQSFVDLHATVFDLPATLKITERFVRAAGLSDRITLLAGNYRSDPIPGSYDLILLSNIIHGENFENNAALLNKLAKNLRPGGRLVIKDHILDEDRAHPSVGTIFSLLMLLTTEGGRCYSFGEVAAWMTAAGLAQVRQLDLPPPLTSSLVVAVK